ncbi:MAG: DUF3223 domain-containing protein [Paludibacter sp.]|nr:DUF3223 domain-containing protein [Paludibacter sp.]
MIQIGDKIYKYKKDALNHYKDILNSYKFGDSLNEKDFNDLIELIEYDNSFFINENEVLEDDFKDKVEKEIVDIIIEKVQFSTKCFKVIYSDYSWWQISYIYMINRPKDNPDSLFNIACRGAIQNDMREIKKKYFFHNSIKGYVKCQETNLLSKWEELAVDHRQPNTFSVIVDRFKELYNIDVTKIEYFFNNENIMIFTDNELSLKFRNYHKEKANLRIVRKECNLSRTGMARIKRTNNDLTIK